MSFMYTSGAATSHISSNLRPHDDNRPETWSVQYRQGFSAGYQAAMDNVQDRLDELPELENKVDELQDQLEEANEQRLYLEHVIEELKDQLNEVDTDPHLLDTHFAEASDAYERLFNEPIGD